MRVEIYPPSFFFYFLISDMIQDIIIKDDPFIGNKKVLGIPKGVVCIDDDMGGIYVEEFLMRFRDYLRFIREDIPIDWYKNQKKCPEFFISWRHDKEVYGYRIYFNEKGLITTERMFLEKKAGEFVLMAEFKNGLPILHSPFWSVGWDGNELLKVDIPESPYQKPLMREVEPLRTIMSDIGLEHLVAPKQCVLSHIKNLSEDDEKYFKVFLMGAGFDITEIGKDWKFYVGDHVEMPWDSFGSGFQYLSSTFPYMMEARIRNTVFIDPTFGNGLHPNLENEMWRQLGSVSKNRNWQIIVQSPPRDAAKAETIKMQSWEP